MRRGMKEKDKKNIIQVYSSFLWIQLRLQLIEFIPVIFEAKLKDTEQWDKESNVILTDDPRELKHSS
jgi:hypothetical protein